jgi:uncharacterized protein (TIGR03435 family)
MAAPAEPMPAYEVATIKPWDGKGGATPLRVYILQAFGFQHLMIIQGSDIPHNMMGWVIGPDWINSTRYVIQGKPPDSVRDAMKTMTPEGRVKENELMMQSLLADRLQLKAHFETREMPLYELVVAKGGPKLKESDPTKRGFGGFGMSANSFRGSATINNLIDILQGVPDIDGRKVIDKTGLTEVYDFSLKWVPPQAAAAPGSESGSAPPPDVEGASLFTTIEEQLGLKLVPTKAPGQVLVIDHIERPSEN